MNALFDSRDGDDVLPILAKDTGMINFCGAFCTIGHREPGKTKNNGKKGSNMPETEILGGFFHVEHKRISANRPLAVRDTPNHAHREAIQISC